MTHLTLPVLPDAVLALGGAAPTNPGRTDLQTVFLTGIAGVNQMAAVTPSERLRLNTAIEPAPDAQQNTLGIVGEIVRVGGPQSLGQTDVDLAGFPNGRRPKDDVTDGALVAVMGGLCIANGTTNALGFGTACTPSAVPLGATSLRLQDAVDQAQVPFLTSFPHLNTPNGGAGAAPQRQRSKAHPTKDLTTRKTFKATLLTAVASAALVACGGGDVPGYDGSTASTPPDTASASSQGFVEFVASLANAMVDGREAFDLSAFNLPTDNVDTLEPARTSIDQQGPGPAVTPAAAALTRGGCRGRLDEPFLHCPCVNTVLTFAVLCLAAALWAPARAVPVQPRHDDEVVEVLPTLGAFAAEQKRLRHALAQRPRDADTPAEIRLQRATLRQYLHEFDAAAAELQALLTLATVYRAQGRCAESDTACLRLVDAGEVLCARACGAENLALRGDFEAPRRELEALLLAQPGSAFWTPWIRTTLGELEARAGRPAQATTQLRAALDATPDDAYARFTLADVLIDATRWNDARKLLGDAQRALTLARSNLQTQREPVDFVVMDRAARAEVAALAAKIGLRDLRLGAADGARS